MARSPITSWPSGVRHVQHRQTIDIDPDLGQVVGDQPRTQTRQRDLRARSIARRAKTRAGG